MYAVEFETKINNGMIEIPKQYKEIRQNDNVRVIVMTDIHKAKNKDKSIFSDFLSTSRQVDALKSYSRDELHAR